MTELSPRFWPVFFEVYEALPRQGPGSRRLRVKRMRALSFVHSSGGGVG